MARLRASLVMASANKKYLRRVVPRGLRNWLRAPSRSVEWFWDEAKYAAGANETIEMRAGFSIVCHPGVYEFAYQLQHKDPDQVEEFDGFIKRARTGMVLFDIGAHFGLFSLAALHYGGPTARALAVDPSPVATKFLNVQSALNHSEERLTIVQAMASDCAGWREMVPTGIIGSGYYVAPDVEHSSSEIDKTRACTIDGLAAEFGLKPTHI